MTATVTAVCRSGGHTFSKPAEGAVRLVAGIGIEGDAHAGATVKHVSRAKRDAEQPNLRQVHLIHGELHDWLNAQGFSVAAGQMGENVTTRGLDLLGLPTGTRLHLGDTAIVELTGLRTPCAQLDRFQKGLLAALVTRDADGQVRYLAGVMGVVVATGALRPGDPIAVELPAEPHRPLPAI